MLGIINSPYLIQRINERNELINITKNCDLSIVSVFNIYVHHITCVSKFNNSNNMITHNIFLDKEACISSMEIGLNIYRINPTYSIDITFDKRMRTVVNKHCCIPILITSNTISRKRWYSFNSASVEIDNMNNVKQIYIFKTLNKYHALFENNDIIKIYYKNNYKPWEEVF